MPHLIPEQLSEVELLKVLGDAQWHSISTILNARSTDITNDHGERLYASFINIDMSFGNKSPRDMGEGSEVCFRHAARFYAKRFVEGFFCFDNQPVPDSTTAGIVAKTDLEHLDTPWIYLTNAFVTREDSNSRLRTFAPHGATYPDDCTTDVLPPGLRDHETTERNGPLSLPGADRGVPVISEGADLTVYPIVPESDLNGAGLLYFARYVAIANYGERLFLTNPRGVGLSARFVRSLTTKRRQIFYFANADEHDSIRISTRASITAPPTNDMSSGTHTTANPLTFFLTTEMRRHSDGALMAASTTEKAVLIPKKMKSLLFEAHRVSQRLQL